MSSNDLSFHEKMMMEQRYMPLPETVYEEGPELSRQQLAYSDRRNTENSGNSDLSMSYDRRDSAISQAESAISYDRRGSAISQGESSPQEDEGAHMGDMSDSASEAGSAGGGKDSGCEVAVEKQEETPYTPPTDEQAERIVAQVEFYFSDANITKDAFLLKHVKRNKEGYVSLKLISSFKRVKHLTKDWRAVAESLKRSTKLQINEAGTKLRRVDPLPQFDETTPSRTVVAVHMPVDKPSVENVSRLFASCGEIALVRVLRPGNPVPADVRQFLNKNPTLVGEVCALVEFTESESARSAMRMQDVDFPGRGARMRVFELNNIPKEPKKKISMSSRRSSTRSYGDYDYSSCCSSSEAEMEYRMYGSDPRHQFRRGSSAYFTPRSPEIQTWVPRRMSACSHSGSDSGVSGFYYSPRRLSSSSQSGSEGYLSRRMSNCSIGSECGPRRPPLGPDGTRGFHSGARQRRISDLALYSR